MEYTTQELSDPATVKLLLDQVATDFPEAYVDYLGLTEEAKVAHIDEYVHRVTYFGRCVIGPNGPCGHIMGQVDGDRIDLWSIYLDKKEWGNTGFMQLMLTCVFIWKKLGLTSWTAVCFELKTLKALEKLAQKFGSQYTVQDLTITGNI